MQTSNKHVFGVSFSPEKCNAPLLIDTTRVPVDRVCVTWLSRSSSTQDHEGCTRLNFVKNRELMTDPSFPVSLGARDRVEWQCYFL
jgi:hypothetical protein